ncbi:MAG: nicotinate-nucleotide adenylyltransferase [Anaerolineae bacterium]|nr:nicotinate-nucleotide adenylyltransferase [Anaerolineae bacterium]
MAAPSIGVFGGTFDPPHVGHLILAESACDALDLSQVLFVPAADPPHKHTLAITPIQHRLAMLQTAIANNPRFVISDVDLARPGPHYTADTLRILREQHPAATLYFLLGGDSLYDLPTWREPDKIIAQAKLAVMRRPGADIDVSRLEAQLPGIAGCVVFVDAPMIGISATTLRERMRRGHSIRYQVPEAIERYITDHQLYKGE